MPARFPPSWGTRTIEESEGPPDHDPGDAFRQLHGSITGLSAADFRPDSQRTGSGLYQIGLPAGTLRPRESSEFAPLPGSSARS